MVKWTEKHSIEARKQGWDLFSIDGNPSRLQIQKDDESGIFKTDSEAIDFVKGLSTYNTRLIKNNFFIKTCKLALKLVTE